MRILVLSCAEDEFAEAVDYYNEQRPGLGFEFAGEVQRTLRADPTPSRSLAGVFKPSPEMPHRPIPLRCAIPKMGSLLLAVHSLNRPVH
jgi:hypothetical protein